MRTQAMITVIVSAAALPVAAVPAVPIVGLGWLPGLLEDNSTTRRLGLHPTEAGGTRLVSRRRPELDRCPASLLMSALAEPGTFIMEQKMLRTIRDRAGLVAWKES